MGEGAEKEEKERQLRPPPLPHPNPPQHHWDTTTLEFFVPTQRALDDEVGASERLWRTAGPIIAQLCESMGKWHCCWHMAPKMASTRHTQALYWTASLASTKEPWEAPHFLKMILKTWVHTGELAGSSLVRVTVILTVSPLGVSPDSSVTWEKMYLICTRDYPRVWRIRDDTAITIYYALTEQNCKC